MKRSEVLEQLIELAFDPNPGEVTVGLRDALGLLRWLVEQESEYHVDPTECYANPYAHTGDEVELEPAPEEPAPEPEPEPEPKPSAVYGPKAKDKRDILTRLEEYRRERGRVPQITAAADGRLTDTDVWDILAGRKIVWAKWEALKDALDKIEKAEADDVGTWTDHA